MAQYAGGEGNVVPLLVEELFGSYTLIRLGYIYFLLLIVPEGNIGEVRERIATGVPIGRAPVMTSQMKKKLCSYLVRAGSPTISFSPTNFPLN
jgi:hypothetical protein